MFRHRKRLIAKRLTYRIHLRNTKNMRNMFRQFIKSRAKNIQILDEQNVQIITDERLQLNQSQKQNIKNIQKNIFMKEQDISSQQSEQDYQVDTDNYQLPPTFFMNKKQKQKYFKSKNQQFQTKIKKTHQRISKNKHRVHFTSDFSYKAFSEHQKVNLVRQAQQYKQKYDNKIHFS